MTINDHVQVATHYLSKKSNPMDKVRDKALNNSTIQVLYLFTSNVTRHISIRVDICVTYEPLRYTMGSFWHTRRNGLRQIQLLFNA